MLNCLATKEKRALQDNSEDTLVLNDKGIDQESKYQKSNAEILWIQKSYQSNRGNKGNYSWEPIGLEIMGTAGEERRKTSKEKIKHYKEET